MPLLKVGLMLANLSFLGLDLFFEALWDFCTALKIELAIDLWSVYVALIFILDVRNVVSFF